MTENIFMSRDLKAENVLLGADGAWKLCDFGSVSTNHKRFDKPEDMGIEEDNIRKHTTPAYRAPEVYYFDPLCNLFNIFNKCFLDCQL
jgi:serine/threonine protein kinase